MLNEYIRGGHLSLNPCSQNNNEINDISVFCWPKDQPTIHFHLIQFNLQNKYHVGRGFSPTR